MVKQLDGQILAFRVVHDSQFHVWLADANLALNRLADDRVVAPAVSREQRAVCLNFRCLIQLLTKSCANPFCERRVALKAVAGDLEAFSDSALESFKKSLAVALSRFPTWTCRMSLVARPMAMKAY